MTASTMVVLIVLIVTVGQVLASRTRRRDRLAARDGTDAADNARLQAEVARLNERIRVLERLATDPARRLSDEIESLKDK